MEYTVIKKQNNSDMCAVCGFNNPYSLKADFFEVQGGIVVGLTQGLEEHQSYPHRMHGGLISALLDESMGRAIQIPDPNIWGVTSELSVKFRKPVPLGEPLKIVGYITKETQRIFIGEGFIEDNEGKLLATAKATYIKIPLEKIVNDDSCKVAWEYMPKATDPKTINIVNPIIKNQE